MWNPQAIEYSLRRAEAAAEELLDSAYDADGFDHDLIGLAPSTWARALLERLKLGDPLSNDGRPIVDLRRWVKRQGRSSLRRLLLDVAPAAPRRPGRVPRIPDKTRGRLHRAPWHDLRAS